MELSYLQNCPSCGAPVELAEADRVVTCPFCDNSNYMVNTGPLRFVLPDVLGGKVGRDQIIHVPYLRFKGHIYSCLSEELEYKIVDTTQLGYHSNQLPVSLGLRPQAMKIHLLEHRHPGRFIKLNEKVVDIFSKAAQLTSAFQEERDTLYHRAFIGETISFIYLPTYWKNTTLMDGVLNRPISRRKIGTLPSEDVCAWKKAWKPRFISTLCPHCGATMRGERDSLVLECHNCQSLYHENQGRFEKTPFRCVDTGRGKHYLPFWRIATYAEGLELQSFADFIKLTNQPVVLNADEKTREHVFWVPGFKIRPKDFLHIATSLTIAQRKLPEGEGGLQKKMFPTTLPAREAVQALKTILASAVMNKRKFMQKLPRVRMRSSRIELVYLPFHPLGQDLVQDHTSLAISRKILYYGRTM